MEQVHGVRQGRHRNPQRKGEEPVQVFRWLVPLFLGGLKHQKY
jgi:hypothetical protein